MKQEHRKTIGNIYKLQRFCVNDGCGIRTTVFLKGCPLSCKWCHNPEAMSAENNIMVNLQLCKLCGKCVTACPNDCHDISDSSHLINRQLCVFCGKCEQVCPANAIEIVGKKMSLQDVMDVITRDEAYYKQSGGGVTISGGEPLIQLEFVRQLVHLCKEKGYSVYIDTSGCVSNEIFRRAIKDADGVLYDLKIIDSEKHTYYTGLSNAVILKNFEYMCSTDKDLIARYVVIPQINDSSDDIQALAEFLKGCNFSGNLEFLAYHRLGINKYQSLNIDYELCNIQPPSESDMEKIVHHFKSKGFNAFFNN